MKEKLDNLPAGWFWSYGSHPEFQFECRIWRRLKFAKIEIYIGIGNSLESAIDNCYKRFIIGRA